MRNHLDFIGYLKGFSGILSESLWDFSGIPVGFLWDFYGASCGFSEMPIGFLWDFDKISLRCMWDVYAISVE